MWKKEKIIYCESTLIPGYQFLWIREGTQSSWILEFVGLRFEVYTSMGISFALVLPTHDYQENLWPTNNSTFTVHWIMFLIWNHGGLYIS